MCVIDGTATIRGLDAIPSTATNLISSTTINTSTTTTDTSTTICTGINSTLFYITLIIALVLFVCCLTFPVMIHHLVVKAARREKILTSQIQLLSSSILGKLPALPSSSPNQYDPPCPSPRTLSSVLNLPPKTPALPVHTLPRRPLPPPLSPLASVHTLPRRPLPPTPVLSPLRLVCFDDQMESLC